MWMMASSSFIDFRASRPPFFRSPLFEVMFSCTEVASSLMNFNVNSMKAPFRSLLAYAPASHTPAHLRLNGIENFDYSNFAYSIPGEWKMRFILLRVESEYQAQ